jgi:hypothetical protein
MIIRKDRNGNLEMTADVNEQEDIQHRLSHPEGLTMISLEASFISDFLSDDPMGDGISYEQVPPAEVGALTGAPLISDGNNIYGYMEYQVNNFLENLATGRTVIWKKG